MGAALTDDEMEEKLNDAIWVADETRTDVEALTGALSCLACAEKLEDAKVNLEEALEAAKALVKTLKAGLKTLKE